MTKAGTFNFIRFDYRSVGTFQVLLGISLLYNLIIRFSYATELYGSHSIIPFEVFKKMNGPASYSIFNLIRNDFFSQAFFVVAMLLCLGYIFGRYYKVFAIALTFFYWNILQGSSAFVFGFEFFTFQLLFWSCFLPVGYRPWNGKNFVYSQPNFTICLVLTIQIVWVYFATGIVKYGESWDGGYAVRNMAADQLATWGIAGFLFSTPWAYTLFTYLTLFFEYTFPVWVLMPYKNHYFRLVAVLFLLGFHTGIYFSYHVANFSLSGVAVAFLLVPAWLWDKVKFSRLSIADDALKLPVWQMVFCVFAIYVISIKSIIFTIKNGSAKKSKKTEQVLSKLAVIDFPKLVKVSFFTQHWKMFAPNPPVKCGWLALEELKDNGDIYDCATGKKVEEKPERFWTPKGFEYYMIMYARNFDFPDGKGDKFKVFLKYWIPYKLKELGLEKVDIKNIFLTDYLYIIANQTDLSKVPVKRNITGALKIINQSFPVLEADPIN